MAEQPVVGGLARGQEGHDLAARLLEALGRAPRSPPASARPPPWAPAAAQYRWRSTLLATACPAPGRVASRTPCRPSATSSPAAGRPCSWPPRAAPRPTPSRSARPPGRTAASRCPACCRSSRWASTRRALVVPAGSAVAPSSHVSARCTASAMAEAGLLRDRRDEPDRARRQLPGQVVVHRAGLLAAGHHAAGAAEHLAEPGEDLAEVGHVEFAAATERRTGPDEPEPGVGVLLAALSRGRGRPRRRSRKAGQPCPQRYSPAAPRAASAGHAVSEPPCEHHGLCAEGVVGACP